MEIEKTNRMNSLFECYSTLLTQKQMSYMELYYAYDYSLGEIAEEYKISRQAVYDNIKRTEKILEDYEKKLHIYSDYIVREDLLDQIKDYINSCDVIDKQFLMNKIKEIEMIDED